MKRTFYLVALALVATLVLGATRSAHAQTAFVPFGNAYTAVGRFSGSNQNWLVSLNVSTGVCARTAFGPAAGLPAGTSYVVGTALTDVIFLVESTTTQCGPWGSVLPPARSIFNWININAGDSADWVLGASLPRVRVGGDNGNDIVETSGTTSDVELYGFNGADRFYSGTNAKVFGENDNDVLCVRSGQTVAQYWGGAGADTYCGSVSAVNSASSLCPCP